MARMTITVHPELLEEARRLSGAKTERETVQQALAVYVTLLRRRRIAEHAGRMELDLTPASLERLREGR